MSEKERDGARVRGRNTPESREDDLLERILSPDNLNAAYLILCDAIK
jgi:hypothetical protein